jgi:hypothetical protein
LPVVSQREISGALTERTEAPPATLHVRWWTIGLGLVLIVPNNYWVVYMEKVRTGPYPTTISIFANCIFLLLVLLVVNAPLRRWFPRIALNRAELLTVYSMLCLGSALAGLDMIPVLVQMMGHPFQFSNESNGWLNTFGKYLPRELMVTDVDPCRATTGATTRCIAGSICGRGCRLFCGGWCLPSRYCL